MKKIIALGLLLCGAWIQLVSAQEVSDFQKKLSCKLTEKSVRIYLIPETETLKCQEYLAVLNGYLKTEYQAMMQVMSNLNRGDDVEYRKTLYNDKKELFLKLFTQKKLIQSAILELESELLIKSKLYLQTSLLEKQQELELAIATTQEKLLASPNDSSLQKAVAQLKLKQEVIDALLTTETMDGFINNFSTYLTLFPLPAIGK